MSERAPADWLPLDNRRPTAHVRLFCFPYAGGGAALFRPWATDLPSTIDVQPVQLPGREGRLRDRPFTSMTTVVPAVADAIEARLDQPFALFGHSLGAFIAFELAREFARRGTPAPVHLFVSGQRPPHTPPRWPPVYALRDAEFLAAIIERYDAVPRDVLAHPELMRILMPLLRADFTMHDTYAFVPSDPLECPVTAFCAEDDPEAPASDAYRWREQTRSRFNVRAFSGGHFFLNHERSAMLCAIAAELAPLTSMF